MTILLPRAWRKGRDWGGLDAHPCLQSPVRPAGPIRAREQLDPAGVTVHPLDDVIEDDRLLAVPPPVGLDDGIGPVLGFWYARLAPFPDHERLVVLPGIVAEPL